MNTSVIVGSVVVLVLLVIGGIMLSRQDNESSLQTIPGNTPVKDFNLLPDEGTTPTAVGSPATSPAAAGQVKAFTVTGSNLKFSPAELRVKQGDTVRVTFVSGDMTHDLRIDGYNVATKVLPAGQQETIEFVADKAGSFEYYCSVGQHRQLGMKGTLVVE